MHKVPLFNLRAIALPGDLIIDGDVKCEKNIMCARVDIIEYCLDRVVISFDIAPE